MLRDVSGLAEHQKSHIWFCQRITSIKNSCGAALKKALGIAHAKIGFKNIHWYKLHYTPSIPQQVMLYKQILCKATTELQCIERSGLMKDVIEQTSSTFELRPHQRMSDPSWKTIEFQQREKQSSEDLNNNISDRLSVESSQCIVGTEKNPASGI